MFSFEDEKRGLTSPFFPPTREKDRERILF